MECPDLLTAEGRTRALRITGDLFGPAQRGELTADQQRQLAEVTRRALSALSFPQPQPKGEPERVT